MHKLRQEKDVLESKLKEFERSLQKLKDCTYQEATQKRDYERRLQALLADHRAVQADLKGASLREQVNRCPFDTDPCGSSGFFLLVEAISMLCTCCHTWHCSMGCLSYVSETPLCRCLSSKDDL